jgi:hypothetical protein
LSTYEYCALAWNLLWQLYSNEIEVSQISQTEPQSISPEGESSSWYNVDFTDKLNCTTESLFSEILKQYTASKNVAIQTFWPKK